jgi:polyisoprenoid-binding protein YceI
MRRRILAVLAVLVLALGGAFAFFAVRGGDAPPPPALSAAPSATATPTPAEPGAQPWRVAGADSFVGYRVREEFATIGVVDAVGRTREVTGTAQVRDDRIESAELEADLTALRSDESRRDDALRTRGIETDRFPTATFRLSGPVALSSRPAEARGELTLHGETQPIRVSVRGQRLGAGAIELVGSAPIAFERFGIEPPSIAGFVTVRDEGTLEFRLGLLPG